MPFTPGQQQNRDTKTETLQTQRRIGRGGGGVSSPGGAGPPGAAGPPNVLSIGTVTEGAADATITGTSPAQVLNLVVPKGNPGTDGTNGTNGHTPMTTTTAVAGVGTSTIIFFVSDETAFVPQQLIVVTDGTNIGHFLITSVSTGTLYTVGALQTGDTPPSYNMGVGATVGIAGLEGQPGTNGTNGVDGTNGTNGVDGTNGTNGVNGTNGTNGVDGTNGTNGVDGANGTNGHTPMTTTTAVAGVGTSTIIFFVSDETAFVPQQLIVVTDGTNIGHFLITSVSTGTLYTVGALQTGDTPPSYNMGIGATVGIAGLEGQPGTNGTNGVDGTNGTNGVDGTNGTNGVDGANGTNGHTPMTTTTAVAGVGTSTIIFFVSDETAFVPQQLIVVTDGTNIGHFLITSVSTGTLYTVGALQTGDTPPSYNMGIGATVGIAGLEGQPGTNGTNGVDGTNGTNGVDGTNGTNGVDGANGTNGLGYTSKGAWALYTVYAVNDVVGYNGSSYVALSAFTSYSAPDVDTGNWTLWAAKGDTGSNGTNGLSLTPVGAWVSGTLYAVNDVVSDVGCSYASKTAFNSYTAPASDPTNWALLASKGDTGPNNITTATTTNLTGPLVGNGSTVNTVTPVTDGTYAISSSLGGSVTIASGIITAWTPMA